MKRDAVQRLGPKITALKRLAAKDPRVLGVFLFGSQVDGYATPRRDIDLLCRSIATFRCMNVIRNASQTFERTLIEQRDFEPRAQAALRDYFDSL